jgi:hypothetical protein
MIKDSEDRSGNILVYSFGNYAAPDKKISSMLRRFLIAHELYVKGRSFRLLGAAHGDFDLDIAQQGSASVVNIP